MLMFLSMKLTELIHYMKSSLQNDSFLHPIFIIQLSLVIPLTPAGELPG